jgi:two-component system, chemotaxis family, protein-glutamate methylesterase/glutaminase
MQPRRQVATHDIIVIGASAGGVEAIMTLVAELPRDLHASVFVVLHVARGRSVFPDILSRSGRLPAAHPADGEALQYGRIYVAPPDHHMTVEPNRVRVLHGPSENGVRPAVDPLFRSAARVYGSRVVGVILTGSLDDGTAGLAAVKQAGGIAVVQDPDEAFAPSMPRSAMGAVRVDHVLPLREIAVFLRNVTLEDAREPPAPPEHGPHLRQLEPDLGRPGVAVTPSDRPGALGVFSCPECNGVLWETDDGGVLRFRCRVGHVYSSDSMLAAQTDSVDRALWAALRSLEERAALTKKMADRATRREQHWIARAFEERSKIAADHAVVVRELLAHRTAGHVVPDHSIDEEAPQPPDMLAEDPAGKIQ